MSETLSNRAGTKALLLEPYQDKSPYQYSQLTLIDLKHHTKQVLHQGDGVVTHFGFTDEEVPFFLLDTDPHFERLHLDLYKIHYGERKNLAFLGEKIFLIATKEGLDQLVEYDANYPTIHTTPFSVLMSLEVRDQTLWITGLLPTNESYTIPFGATDPTYTLPFPIKPLQHPTLKGWQVGSFLPNHLILIRLHGGPIGQSECTLSKEAHFYHEHGYSVIYLNYSGSTGYGRKHRLALLGNYGVKEVEETIELIDWLEKQGLKSEKIFLKGKSSAGLSVLLTAVRKKVRGLSVYCPVTENLKEDPELYSLFPEDFDPYQELAHLHTPMILFQGNEDTCIPIRATNRFVAHFSSQTSIIYRVLPNVGHSIRETTESLCFLDEHTFFEGL